MSVPAVATEPFDTVAVGRKIMTVLGDFLDAKAHQAASWRMPAEVIHAIREFLTSGGKRLRPLLCVAGWHAAGGEGHPALLLRTAASLEMFHAFCLIHDDIMDNSTTRRGRPTVHRALADHHMAGRDSTAAARLGVNAAILLGDLALTWSDELLHTAGLSTSQLTGVLPVIDAMRAEVMYGQYLDLTATGTHADDLDQALAIIRYKTAKYTVERPLHIGATLAGADHRLRGTLTAFAIPLGEAFQLRDDLLGVFGDPGTTGKPGLDDLREGKHTALLALAMRRATAMQRRTLCTVIGDPHLDEAGADRIREVLTATGAPDAVERLIRQRHQQADHALNHAGFPPETLTILRGLAHAATMRTT